MQQTSFTLVVRQLVQDAINSTDLPFLSGSVEAVSPTQVRFGLSTELTNTQKLPVILDAFPLELFNTDSETNNTILTLNLPEQRLEKKSTTAVNIEPQTLEIQSQAELRKFLAKAFSAANKTTIGVRGRTKAHVLGSHVVTLQKTVSINGLNNLAGMKVDTLVPAPPGGFGAQIPADDPLDSIATINGSLIVSNPSQLTLTLGDVRHNVYSAGVLLGECHVTNLRLVPGEQTMPYEGTLNVDDIVDKANNFANFSKIMNGATDDGRIPFEIVGDKAYVNGEHIEYLDEVLSQIKLRVTPCVSVTQKAIPLNKSYLDMSLLLPDDEVLDACDEKAPVSGS